MVNNNITTRNITDKLDNIIQIESKLPENQTNDDIADVNPKAQL